jgi:5-methylcytosine-specific restriction enzyme A
MIIRPDWRSPEAAAYRALYKKPEWRAARATQLAKQPLCERCLAEGISTAANVVNHKIPHKGDLVLFRNPANHQSVCKPHHDGPIQRDEHAGFSAAVDAAGWPTDPLHRSMRLNAR